MRTAVMLFTRDLRVHDNPALTAALASAEHVVPLFVWDDGLAAPPNRARFLAESVADLRESLRARGGDLLVRRGDPAAEVAAVLRDTEAGAVFLSADVSRHAARRLRALSTLPARVTACPGLTVVPPGDLRPAGGDHYRVFTPYWRAWERAPRRPLLPPPAAVRLPPALNPAVRRDAGPARDPAVRLDGGLVRDLAVRRDAGPARDPAVRFDGGLVRDLAVRRDAGASGGHGYGAVLPQGVSAGLARGGESAGRRALAAWRGGPAAEYGERRDDLAADGTSRLSAYLRFGCLSPLEVEAAGTVEFGRQLCWRDFHYQVAAAFPDLAVSDYRPGRADWCDDADALDAWREGLTGVPIVDAGMRQLRAEGFMHNRARMITASFLTRNLRIDWRHGLAHFAQWLADADLPNNAGNWQWTAGTGLDTRPNRVMNPLRQAARFDPDGTYVRRYVPELAGVPAPLVHRPWTGLVPGYPPPIADLA